MTTVAANGIEIEYETIGDRGDTPLLLVHGLGGQLIDWDDEFVQQLAGRGFFVIRFDNRDMGFSTWFDERGVPDLMALLGGDHSVASYLLADMASDAAGLLDELGIAAAHVVGVSMGGMIAQQLVIDHPSQVLSLCSIMSTTGDQTVGQPSPEASEVLLTPPPASRDDYIDHEVVVWRVIGSPGFAFDEDRVRARAGADFDRAFHPSGVARQLAAILASPDRTSGLSKISVPAQVIHGSGDVLVNPSGGLATHAAIPGSDLLVIDGMGHDLPADVWSEVLDSIEKNARRA